MIADKILRSEISRLKILSVNFKIQPQRLKFNRTPALNLAARPQFGYARILNFIGCRKTLPAKQMRRRAYLAATPNRAVNFIVSQRVKFYTAKQEPVRRRIKFAPQSEFRAAAWFAEILRAKLALQNPVM